jgi:hypothetical protein
MICKDRKTNAIAGVIFILTGAITAFGSSQDLASAAVWFALGAAFFLPSKCRTKSFD